MGNCCDILAPNADNILPTPTKSKTPNTKLDPKYKGKYLRLNKACTVATGRGLILGKESLNTDKVYFEVTFHIKPKKSNGDSVGASKTLALPNESGAVASTQQRLAALKCATPNPKHESVDPRANNTPSSMPATPTGATPTTPSTPSTPSTPALPTDPRLPYFQLGVAVKSNIRNRKLLNRTGQPTTVEEDDKARWMWSWGPAQEDVSLDGTKHVLGVAYDQSVGPGTIVVYHNGVFVSGPLPSGIRGIKGTCHPLLVLSPSTNATVTATCNFSVNECDFVHPPPEGFGGIIPAMNTL